MDKSKNGKPIVIFTSFWDANYLIDKEFFLFEIDGKPNIIWLRNKNGKADNYSVHSIALRAPSLEKVEKIEEQCKKISCIDFFCPTYQILMDYKNNKKWDVYTNRFKDLMRERKEQVIEWVNNLEPNHVYILCCWESTGEGTYCHRQILHRAFNASNTISEKIITIYRHGRRKLDSFSYLIELADHKILDHITHNSFATLSESTNLANDDGPSVNDNFTTSLVVEVPVDITLNFHGDN